MNKRIDDLHEALATGSKRNGNHLIRLREGPHFPDAERCADCNLNLSCLAIGHIPTRSVSTPQPLNIQSRPCIAYGETIEFFYHDSLCLSFNTMSKVVTDHGMWGYSVTTSRSIRWYLEALYYEQYIGSQTHVDELCKLFKKRTYEEADQWVPVNSL